MLMIKRNYFYVFFSNKNTSFFHIYKKLTVFYHAEAHLACEFHHND